MKTKILSILLCISLVSSSQSISWSEVKHWWQESTGTQVVGLLGASFIVSYATYHAYQQLQQHYWHEPISYTSEEKNALNLFVQELKRDLRVKDWDTFLTPMTKVYFDQMRPSLAAECFMLKELYAYTKKACLNGSLKREMLDAVCGFIEQKIAGYVSL